MGMRTHREIVQTFGASNLARELLARGIEVHQSTPQRWADRDSIPGEYWSMMVELDAASLAELAEAAARRARQGAQ